MKTILKWVLGLLGTLVLLAVLAVILLPVLVDGEALKAEITEQVKAETGRTLVIGGDLGFSVFPRLAVAIGDLRVGEAGNPADQPYGTISEARISVSLLPLLRQQLVVNGLSVEGADLEYRDETGGIHYGLRELSARTGPLELGESGPSSPVRLDVATRLEDLVAGTVTQLDLTTVATLDVGAERYTLDDLSLEATPEQFAAPVRLDTPRLIADLAEQTVVMDTFSLGIGGLEMLGSLRAREVLGDPVFDAAIEAPEFAPRTVMTDLGLAPLATADPGVFARAALSAKLIGTLERITLDDLEMQLDDSRINGQVTVADFAAPAVRFDLVIDAIDLDRYMPPAEEQSAGADEAIVIPAADLGAQDIEGTLRVGQLRMMGLDLSDAEVGLRAKEGVTRVHPLTAGFFGGRYDGDIRLDSRGDVPKVSFDERVESVLFEQMAADLLGYRDLTGVALGHFKAEGAGFTADEVLESLRGSLALGLDEGALEGIDIWYEIRKAVALFKGEPVPEGDRGRTAFSTLQLDASLADGLLRTNELTGQLPFLTLDGDGAINLRDLSIDLGLIAAVRSVPELESDPLAADLRGRRVPLRIRGGLADPDVAVDVETLLKEEATDLLLDRLGITSQPQDGEPSENDATLDAAKKLLKGLRGDKDDDSR